MAKRPAGAVFLRYFVPLLEALRELGGEATSGDATDRVIERLRISKAALRVRTASGQSRVRNQIAWARFVLVSAGYLDRRQRGVWTLSEKGRTAGLDEVSASAIFTAVIRIGRDRRRMLARKK